MKYLVVLFINVLLTCSVNAQSIYREKWKEGVFFQVPITFEKKVCTDEKVVFRHNEGEAELHIYQWPFSYKAQDQIQLDNAALNVADKLGYASGTILSKEIINEYDPSPDFKGSRIKFEQGGKLVQLVTLYSSKTETNYALVVEASKDYAGKYRMQLKRLSEGLEEF